MEKEKLTIQNIKADLWNETKYSFYKLILLTLLFLFVLVAIFWDPLAMPHVELVAGDKFQITVIIFEVLFGFSATLVLYYIVKILIEFVNLHKALCNIDCIVIDKLVGMEIKEHMTRNYLYETCHLHFSGYGEYKIPDVNYLWSSMYPKSGRAVYDYSTFGDEFYLVLSKPYSGKILYAYNTKMFEMG